MQVHDFYSERMGKYDADCSSNSCSYHQYNSDIVIPLGATLLVCTILGIPVNSILCYYFTRVRQVESQNGRFFSRIYALISAAGCGICIVQIPMVQAFINGRRAEDLIYQSVGACHVWYVLWLTLTQVNVFLVAELSISRFFLIAKTNRKMVPLTAWLLPLLFGCLMLLIMYIIPVSSGRSIVSNNKEHAMCLIKAKNDSLSWSQSSYEEQTQFVYSGSVLLILFTGSVGFPILPIFISCVLSLIYLRRSEENARSAGGSVSAQRRSSVTVVVFTTVYIVFNIPLFIRVVGVTYFNAQLLSLLNQGGEMEKIQSYISAGYSYDSSITHFALLLVWGVSTVLNVTVNPIVFYWRMKPFKNFLNKRMEESQVLSDFSTQLQHISTSSLKLIRRQNECERKLDSPTSTQKLQDVPPSRTSSNPCAEECG